MVAPLDFARGVDHEAIAELWDRYSQGERNVFTRRLYTMQGQQVFDDIRKRYRSDQDFRQTVERYLSEFERLLENLAQDDDLKRCHHALVSRFRSSPILAAPLMRTSESKGHQQI